MSGPAWLAELQARFGAMIRTPLDRETGTLAATPSEYDARLLEEALDGPAASAAERLAVYNRQYWFRLFTVMHTAFPLTTRLCGHWHFNDHAAHFLLASPPRSWDLDDVPDGFEVYFEQTLDGDLEIGNGRRVEREALVEAARLDAAWRRVFGAPRVAPYHPSAEDAGRLPASRLRPSPAVAVVEEHWPLCELRRRIRSDSGEAAVPLPPRLDTARAWALVRRPEGIGQLALEAREAELFKLLGRYAVQDALARLEAACDEVERATLPAKAQHWLARSVELGFWIGLAEERAGATAGF
jgi:hypothetical protein